MTVDDRAKLNLYKKLIEVLGQEDADTLMDLLFEARQRGMRHEDRRLDEDALDEEIDAYAVAFEDRSTLERDGTADDSVSDE